MSDSIAVAEATLAPAPVVEIIPNSVTIMGKGLTGRESPFDTAEVWGVNNVAEQPEHAGKKFHRLFAFDLLDKEYTDGMKKFAPVTSWQDYGDVKYPLEKIITEFNTKFFTNTISYMLAYAIFLKFEKIYIYGVEVSFGAPYAQENRGIDYWIGRAQERGIEVIVPPTSHLLRTCSGTLYGERDHCNYLLYLNERINLINVLPRQGTYSDALLAQNAWWVLHPKEDEAKAHGLEVQRGLDGSMNFKCQQEWASDVQMPPETWEYLKGVLRKLESEGHLPFTVISAYEKLVLSKPDGGN